MTKNELRAVAWLMDETSSLCEDQDCHVCRFGFYSCEMWFCELRTGDPTGAILTAIAKKVNEMEGI